MPPNLPVRVQAVIERAPAPPGCVPPLPEQARWWPGTLLSWRWVDQSQQTWTGLVRYRREGLLHEHWISGELLDVTWQATVSQPTAEG